MSEYIPPHIFRNGHANTIAASSVLRKLYAQRASQKLRKESKKVILDLEDDVRLLGFANQVDDHRPLVLMLHGWLGCADSVYILPLAAALYEKDFNVFRLNFRDHGHTQQLNKDLFHSCRLQEILHATQKVKQLIPHRDFFIIGHSLGGNFALRVGAQAQAFNLNIKKIFSICPVMDPERALNETKNMSKIYTMYYLGRWKNMLEKKHKYFPNKYDLTVIKQQTDLNEMTEQLLLQHTEYNSLKEYLAGYSITGDRLKTLSINSDVYIALDDPVIPASDYKNLYASDYLNVHLTEYGGHCGYMNGFFNKNWLDNKIIHQLTN